MGGDKVSTGIFEAGVACRGPIGLVKQMGKLITANTEMALAA